MTSQVQAQKKPRQVCKKTIRREALVPLKTHRFKQGTVALRQIRRYQKSHELLLRRLPFIRLVREIAQEEDDNQLGLRFQKDALETLQHATENVLISILKDTNLIAVTMKKKTINLRYLKLAKRIRNDKFNWADNQKEEKQIPLI